MGERCRCGADLLPGLHFCVGCGADLAVAARPAAMAVGRGPAPSAPVWGPVPRGAAPSYPPVPVSQPTTLRPAPVPAPASYAPFQPAPVPYAPVQYVPVPQAVAPTARAWSPAPWLVALSVVLVVLLSAGAVLVTLRPALVLGDASPTVVPAAAAPTGASGAQPFLPAVAPSASDELRDQVEQDRVRVESTTGWWVPQLSSKKSGTVDGGVRYDDAAILGHYRGLAAQYPGAALLYSGDWPVFRGGDYWVVVVAQPFSTAAQANAWCDAQGFGSDDCFAKSLSHSGGPTGTTVHR
ncbi:hypothetical protein [Pseudonocardia endophytica]|uniref:Uncharacterized protein n=1 Tax=Pseudonocardia endophytica TaxID=401976 RepID=A0A4R1IBF3_PSEEN|nr:hypothetical protein [Pseudonocardia endophytica]TCK27762.1 hypothetical protein EV378_3640 [Pseudonocardia endophytica]